MNAVRIISCLLLSVVAGCVPSMESRSAGEVGCTPDEIAVSEKEYHFALLGSVETWVATCRGRSFVCSHQRDDRGRGELASLFAGPRVSCTEEPESPEESRNREMYAESRRRAAAPPRAAAPTGAAGFEFGASAERAQELCEAAGHQWAAESAREGWCSGPARELGLQATVVLHFCDGHACRISLEHRPASAWSNTVVTLKAGLESKYGDPKERTRGIPVRCRSEAQFARCLETRELELRYGWAWPSGELLEMNVGKFEEADEATIRLIYRHGGSPVSQSAL